MKLFGSGSRRGGRPDEDGYDARDAYGDGYEPGDDYDEYGDYDAEDGYEPDVADEYDGDGYSDDAEYWEDDGDEDAEPFNEFGESLEDVEETAARYRRKKHIRVIIILAVIAVIAGGLVLAYNLIVRPPELVFAVPTTEPAATDGPDETDAPDAEPTEEPQDEYVDNGYRKEYRYTFLIVGLDQVESNTDTIMVGTLDVKDHWLHVVSIPRDTLVNVPWPVKKVNTIYAFSTLGYSGWDYENGMDGLKKGIADLMGYEPDCYALVDVEAFVALVDAIGGVYYDVPVDMNYYDPDQNLSINISAGYQWLSGEDALKVVRFRSGYVTADLGRIGTQQDFLKSVASQMLSLGNIPNISKVYDIYEEYVETNLSVGNIAWFVKEFLKLSEEDITFETMPGDYTQMIGGLSYGSIDIDAWLEILNTKLSPLDKTLTAEDLNILTWDSTLGATATSGDVAGGEDSFYGR